MAGKKRQKSDENEPTKDRLYRLDLTTIAKVDVYARVYDWAMNTLVETAIIEKTERMALDKGIDWGRFAEYATEEGGLLCAMFKCAALLNSWTKREDELRRFVRDHEPFFYTREGRPDTRSIRRLWPKMDIYLRLWNTEDDDWAAWKAMSIELEKHSLPAPPNPLGNARTTESLS